jgi:predicted DNA-binding protein (MmcQ/YjbR family)
MFGTFTKAKLMIGITRIKPSDHHNQNKWIVKCHKRNLSEKTVKQLLSSVSLKRRPLAFL